MKSFIIILLLTFTIFAQSSGTFVDERDGSTYKWVKIGEQVWMAEDLRFMQKSFRYFTDDNPRSRERIGFDSNRKYNGIRKTSYNWLRAMTPESLKTYEFKDVSDLNPYDDFITIKSDSNGHIAVPDSNSLYQITRGSQEVFQNGKVIHTQQTFYRYPAKLIAKWSDSVKTNKFQNSTNIPRNHRGICPKGWHIPSPEEVQQLIEFINDENNTAKHLKKAYDNQYRYTRIAGSDTISFTAKGYDTYGFNSNIYAKYLTTKAYNQQFLRFIIYTNSNKLHMNFYHDSFNKRNGRLRCIRD